MRRMIIRQHIPEHAVKGKRLGRHVNHDPRSREHAADALVNVVTVRHRSIGLPLDQGDIGSCTANALIGVLNTQPNTPAHGPWTEKGAVRLYRRETSNEGQPYPPNDPGGSGLEVCKAAVQMGMIRGYQHAFSVSQALSALAQGPVITGINWYDSMDNPGSHALVTITPDAQIRGGHEIMADEIVVEDKLVGFTNSWGPEYGDKGRFYMSWDTWQRLLSEQGDVTVPVK